MSLNVLIALVLLGLALRVLKQRRAGAAALALAVLLFVVEGCGLLPAWLLGSLQGPYAQRPAIVWAPRNVIVLLGAGAERAADGTAEPGEPAHSRINEALALYRECKASGMDCRLEVSGGDARHIGESEAAVYAVALERMGVSAADLVLEPRSMNTWQNAQFSAPLLHRYGAQRVLLVSSATHLRRASLYFAHFGIATTPVRSDWLKERMCWWPLSWNFAVTDLALHEYAGVLRYHVYNAMGWNAQEAAPGAP